MTGTAPAPSTAPGAAAPVAQLARQLAAQRAEVVDADELVALLEAGGVHDRVAAERYGAPTVFALAEAVLAHLRPPPGGLVRRAVPPAARAGRGYAGPAMARCLLHLAPVLSAVAVLAGSPERFRWPAVAGLLVLGWGGAQALGHLGRVTAARRGPGPAARLLAAGYTVLLILWWLLVTVAPGWLPGPDRRPAQLLGGIVLTGLAAATAAAVTGAHAAVLVASAPGAALAGAALLDADPAGGVPLPGGLLVAAAVPLAVAYRRVGRPATGPAGRLRGADLGRSALHLVSGVGQALAVALLWRAVPDPPSAMGLGGPGWLLASGPPLLAAPLVELLVGWYAARVAAALDGCDRRADFRRRVRRLALRVVVLLLPGLGAGVLLVAAGYRLPYQWADHPQARAGALALAGGVFLAAGYGLLRLLVARHRPAAAAVLGWAPFGLSLGAHHTAPAGWVACPAPCVPGLATPLPLAVGALFAACLIGLAVTAYALVDHRGYR